MVTIEGRFPSLFRVLTRSAAGLGQEWREEVRLSLFVVMRRDQ